jgi:5-methylthioadenosine/S-adenosylhomocysteine deaminase
VRIGVSPHAPYTVSGPLYRATAEWAKAMDLPLAVHLAESSAESALLASGDGAFAEAWRARGIRAPTPPGASPVEWLDRHGVLTSRTLCIHVVHTTEADISRLAAADCAVAHCPLSNRAHGHGRAPLARLLQAGIRVGVGTDSVVSVGELDLLADARAARALASLDAPRTLALCTLEAARALGLESEIGSLSPGKWGDCAAIRLPASASSPEDMALASAPRDVLATFVGGRDVYRNGRPQ